jgi:phenylpropionate dioxygenase-like ring-hydroxylating dioxygenase large terminal subunit
MSVVPEFRGKTLPARAYTSPEVYEQEMQEVFLKAWNFACHVSDVAEPGRFWTTSIAGEPVVVLRDNDGGLRALSNVCRHRAARILSGEGSCPKVLRCPYHGWTYRQDGQLAAVPEARGFTDLDREAVKLPQFRVGEMCGLVFVCMSEETEPLDSYFGDLPEKLGRLRLPEMQASERHPAAYDQNWKVIADNYLEGYHIPVGHPGLLRLLDYKRYIATPGKNHAWIDGPFRDKPSRNYQERLYQRLMRPMPGFPHDLEGAWTYVHLWPATFVDIYPDQIDTWQLFPDGLRHTRTEARVYHSGSGAIRDRVVRAINWRFNKKVMDEDVELCDMVQLGLESRTYERGVLNRNESGVLAFHDLLRRAVPGIDEP